MELKHLTRAERLAKSKQREAREKRILERKRHFRNVVRPKLAEEARKRCALLNQQQEEEERKKEEEEKKKKEE